MKDNENCRRCGGGIKIGSFSTRGLRFGFRPEELRFLSISLQFPEVPLPAKAIACASCGLVRTELDPAELRQKLQNLGNNVVKQRLQALKQY